MLADHVGGGVRPAFQFVPPTPRYPTIDNVLFDPKRTYSAERGGTQTLTHSSLVLSVDAQPNHRSVAKLLLRDGKLIWA